MYLGTAIWDRFSSYAEELKGNKTPTQLHKIVSEMCKPFGTKVILEIKDTKSQQTLIGGEFAPDVVRQPIRIFLFVDSRKKFVRFTEKNTLFFLFMLSQTLQHEMIHKMQYHLTEREFYKHRHRYESIKGDLEDMNYMATFDELETYAHDLAMEIKFFYPQEDAIKVLQHISNYEKLITIKLYQKTFKNANWSKMRSFLLKRTYKWIPFIKESFEIKKCKKD